MWAALFKGFGALVLGLAAVIGYQLFSNSGAQALPARSDDGTLRLASYNVHYIWLDQAEGPWSTGDWERRKGPLDAAFKHLDADLVGFQEMESFSRSGGGTNLTLDWLLAQNPDYAAAAVGDWREFPSTQPILYRRDRLTMLEQGWFFFSTTPDVIYSRTFNGSFPAFASWVRFEDRQSGARFRVYNVHFEFSSRSNRQLSAALTRDRMAGPIAEGETVFLLGDLNARHGSATMQILEEPGLQFAPVRGSTYHFNRGINLFGAIDHIAATSQAQLARPPVVIRSRWGGEWPTDHYPVVADYLLR